MAEGLGESVKGQKFEKLTNANWSEWSFKMEETLRQKRLWDVVDPNSTTSPKSSATATDANDSAFSMLALSVSNRVLPLVKAERSGRSARAVWTNLRDMYEPESLARLVELYNQLIAIKQQPQESIAEYFKRAQHLRNQLISAGGTMDDHAFAMALINGLREEFEIAITMLTTPYTAKQLTAELIRPGLLAYEARMASRHSMQRERGKAMAYAAGGNSYAPRPAPVHRRPNWRTAWQNSARQWAAVQQAAQRYPKKTLKP
jgi:gag-polypeptide of LTR copia-type/Domain of unknown function (DUF4219)